MASDWEEVKRLAADLQRAQLSSTAQRLSDRNCIEIVTKLIELQLLDVYFTTDGKEYITPQQVITEIKDELYVHGGRINLVDLAQSLNLNFSHIEAKVNDLLRSNSNLSLILGQLIDRAYIDRVAEEVNERLQQTGFISFSQVIKEYDLPGDFLESEIKARIGTIIEAEIDPFDSTILYTKAFIQRQRAQVLGALSGITRPTPILNVINLHNFQPRIFHSVVDELIESNLIAGAVSGGRQERAVYIPDVYSKAQKEWVDNFYKQNGYLEYDALTRLGISDPKTYIKKQFANEFMTYLNTCAVGSVILNQIEAAVEEALSQGSWVDIMPIMPSVFSENDGNQMLGTVLKNRSKHTSQAHIFCDTFVCSEKFLSDLKKPFDSVMIAKAEMDAEKGLNLNKEMKSKADMKKGDKKDDRRKKAAGGKSGGGTQGRETKTKAVKKKYRTRDSDESDDDDTVTTRSRTPFEIEFLTDQEIFEQLQKQKQLGECPPELLQEIASELHRPLTKSYQEVVKSVFLASATATGAKRRKAHSELQEKINGLCTNVRLFDKGFKLFSDDVQEQLNKHLLKSIGTEMMNLIISYLIQEHMMTQDSANITPEVRTKVIAQLPQNMFEPLSKLNNSLNGKSLEDFLMLLEGISGSDMCDFIIKKPDKKKERQIAFGLRQALLEQLSSTMDAALTLHLVVLILFQLYTQCALHASGKFVPQILMFLESSLPADTLELLQTFQGLVIKQLTLKDQDELHDVKIQLEELLPKVKEVAFTTKKGSHSEQD